MTTTLNPDDIVGWNPDQVTLTDGNLTAQFTGGATYKRTIIRAVHSVWLQKVYWEFDADFCGSFGDMGPCFATAAATDDPELLDDIRLKQGGQVISNQSYLGFGNTWGTGAKVGIAGDYVNNLYWYTVNGTVWNGVAEANPSTGVGGFTFPAPSVPVFPAIFMTCDQPSDSDKATVRFSRSSMVYAMPEGFEEVGPLAIVSRARSYLID